MKLQMNKAINVPQIEGAILPDAVSRIGNISLDEVTDVLTYAMHFYVSEEAADSNAEPSSFVTYTMSMVNLQNQIIAHAKQQPEFDAATDIE